MAHTNVVYVGFLTGNGGDAMQMLELARRARERGASVRLVVAATPDSHVVARRAAELGLPCLQTHRIRSGLSGPRQRLTSMLGLFSSLNAEVVHLHTGDSFLPRFPMLAMRVLRYRGSIVTIHGPHAFPVSSRRARSWAASANRCFKAVVSPSVHGETLQVECGVDPRVAVTIPNGVDILRWQSGDGARARATIGLGAEDPLIVFSSRLSAQKRPLDAVQIFARVAAEHPTARLVLIGDGELLAHLRIEVARAKLEDRVTMLGHSDDVADWLAASTVWILPTERENFSLAVLEALAAGCTVLSTACPGNSEVLRDGRNALLFDPGDIETAAGLLRQLLESTTIREQLSAQGRRDVLDYDSAVMADRYLEIYDRPPPG